MLAVIAFSFIPMHQVMAQVGEFNINDSPASADGITIGTLETWIRNIANFLISVGVVVAVIFIVWGGLAFMFAGGNTEKAEKAKTRLWNGVIGALIVLGVGLIIRTIDKLVFRGISF